MGKQAVSILPIANCKLKHMVQKLIELALRNRLVVLLLAGGLFAWGIYSIKQNPIDAIPDLSENQVIVFTEWMGRSLQVIEDQVTYPWVSNLQGIPKIRNIQGSSMFGMSFVYVIFEDNVDIYWARTRVLERLNYAQRLLPQGITPTLGPDGTGVGHIFWYHLDAPKMDLGEQRALQDWYVKFALQTVPGVTIPTAQAFNAVTGKGVEATVEGKAIKVVSPGYLGESNILLPGNYNPDAAETVVFVLINNKLVGYIALSDTIRPESAEAIKTLLNNNIKSVLLTGDNKQVAASVAEKLGMNSFFAGVLPHQKLEKIKELQDQGEFVAMAGDGVNDAPALAQANVGIAVGSGSDIAAETAGIVLVNSNPKDIVSLIQFGKATYRKMIQNLIWATGYNVVALPLAAGVLYKMGILLSPAAGAVLMSVSTVIVAINASMLKIK